MKTKILTLIMLAIGGTVIAQDIVGDPPRRNPVLIGGVDDGGKVRRLAVDEFGALSISGFAARPTATFTTPAGNATYTSGNLVANSANSTLVSPLTWTVGRVAGGTGMIRRVRIISSSTSITNASYRLHLYRTSPTTSAGDNGAWLTNQVAAYMGSVDVVINTAFTDGSQGIGIPNAGSEINFILPPGQSAIFGLLEARAARARVGAETFTTELELLQN